MLHMGLAPALSIYRSAPTALSCLSSIHLRGTDCTAGVAGSKRAKPSSPTAAASPAKPVVTKRPALTPPQPSVPAVEGAAQQEVQPLAVAAPAAEPALPVGGLQQAAPLQLLPACTKSESPDLHTATPLKEGQPDHSSTVSSDGAVDSDAHRCVAGRPQQDDDPSHVGIVPDVLSE